MIELKVCKLYVFLVGGLKPFLGRNLIPQKMAT